MDDKRKEREREREREKERKKEKHFQDYWTTNICLLLPCPCSLDTFNPLVDTILH